MSLSWKETTVCLKNKFTDNSRFVTVLFCFSPCVQFWHLAPGTEPGRPHVSAELQSQWDGDGATSTTWPTKEGYFFILSLLCVCMHPYHRVDFIMYRRVTSSLFVPDRRSAESVRWGPSRCSHKAGTAERLFPIRLTRRRPRHHRPGEYFTSQ